MVARVEIEGLAATRKALKGAGADMAEMRAAGKQAAEIVAEEAKARTVPRRTGALAGSIRAAGQQSGAVVRAGGARIPYANVIHFGWAAHNIEPQPFLYDALDLRADDVRDRYQQELDDIVSKHGLD